MNRAALVIHTVSYPFVQNVALFIHKALCEHYGPDTPLLLCDNLEELPHADDTVYFLIGENFPAFRRRSGCRYVYLNFSVVTVLSRPWESGIKARRAIRYKWKLLAGHLSSVDVVLDYYPPQTELLGRKLDLPVHGFAVACAPNRDFTPMRAREYDVCFVCSLNDRRREVRRSIENSGITLSPSRDVAIEDAAARSRLCLNVHAVKSHHFETPRFVAALSSGTPVVSETCFAFDTIIEREFVSEAECNRLPSLIENLLSDPDRLDELGRQALHWYTTDYLPRARARWRQTIASVETHLS